MAVVICLPGALEILYMKKKVNTIGNWLHRLHPVVFSLFCVREVPGDIALGSGPPLPASIEEQMRKEAKEGRIVGRGRWVYTKAR